MILNEFIAENGLKFQYRSGCDRRQLDLGVEELFISEYMPKKKDVIIDVGAHIGTFALNAGLKVTEGRVYAIEPCLETYILLNRNVAINKLTNIHTFNLGLFNRRGRGKLYYFPEHESFGNQNWGNTLTACFDKGETVKLDTLKHFLDKNNISKCDFMKINCEGSEFEIILSSDQDCLRRINLMLILYHSDLNRKHKYVELTSYLNKCGFDVKIRNQETERGWIIANKYI